MLFINFQPVVTFVVRFLEGSRFRLLEVVGATIVVCALVANTLYLRTFRVVRYQDPEHDGSRPKRGDDPC
jgi:hypothetical protein